MEKWLHSACSMCIAAPMKVKVKDGKIAEVKGEDIPGWRGKLCGKAFAGTGERIYGPDRILYPLKRVGERGEGKFVRCTWDEIIDALASRLKEYIAAGHPEMFEIWWGCPVQQDHLHFLYYWSAVTGAGISYMHGQPCYGDHAAEKAITFGSRHGGLLTGGTADWVRTKYAVIGGMNFPGTALQSARCNVPNYALFNRAKQNGCRFIVVDPKLADTAPWCDEWLPIGPGKDAIFALAVANVLLREKLYDEDFLLGFTNAPQLIRVDNGQPMKDAEGHYLGWNTAANAPKPVPKAGEREGLTLGLGKVFKVKVGGEVVDCKTALQLFAEEAEKYLPEATEFPEKTIEIARNLGANKPAVVFFPGFTSGRYSNWFQTMRAYSAVSLLLGCFDRPGGFYFTKHAFGIGDGWPEPPQVPEYAKGVKLVSAPGGNRVTAKSIDKESAYKEVRDFHPATLALPWLHFEAIEQGRVRAVLSSAENAALTQPDSKWVEDCLKKTDLILVGDQVPKEFIDLADYVIPEAAYLERYHLYAQNYLADDGKEHGLAFMRSAVVPPPGESKPLSWFLVQVGKRIGLGQYFEGLDLEYEWWDRMLKKAGLYPKVTAKKLIEEGPYVEDYDMQYNVLFSPIATRSGRFEIYSNELAEHCYHNPKSKWYHNPHVFPLPIYLPLAEPKGKDEFYLLCGKAVWHQKSATQHNRYLMEDAIEGGCPYTAVYINADRAKALGIEDGDSIELECIGPTHKEDPCVQNEAAIGVKGRGRVKLTNGLHPEALWVYFAGGHKSKLMMPKAREGIAINWFIPAMVTPYAGAMGKNYSLVKVRKVNKGSEG